MQLVVGLLPLFFGDRKQDKGSILCYPYPIKISFGLLSIIILFS